MGQVSLINGLQYAGYALELALLALLLSRKRLRRFPALCAYVAALFGLDALGRSWVLERYPTNPATGAPSTVYFYFYYLSDFVLALGLFLLVCTFFRRACRDHQKVWDFIRPILSWIFVLLVMFSAVALRANFHNLLSRYIFEFDQDTYFVCLVLNTALYVMVQQFKAEGDLSLLACGLGVQLGGQTAGSALASLTYASGHVGSGMVLKYLSPLCFLAMMVIWLYAIARSPSEAERIPSERRLPQRDLVSQPAGFKSITALGQNRRVAGGPNALQAGYLQPLRTRV